jgi:hypothetical protein
MAQQDTPHRFWIDVGSTDLYRSVSAAAHSERSIIAPSQMIRQRVQPSLRASHTAREARVVS